ncbi:hypothetical protein ACHAW6_007608 [Cyclotella cf. meneghiniana]
MTCPLSRFIHFATNDCGHSEMRYDLIVNWVHPLFLKAKSNASKIDSPSWKQAMSGPFKRNIGIWQSKRYKLSSLWMLGRWWIKLMT